MQPQNNFHYRYPEIILLIRTKNIKNKNTLYIQSVHYDIDFIICYIHKTANSFLKNEKKSFCIRKSIVYFSIKYTYKNSAIGLIVAYSFMTGVIINDTMSFTDKII